MNPFVCREVAWSELTAWVTPGIGYRYWVYGYIQKKLGSKTLASFISLLYDILKKTILKSCRINEGCFIMKSYLDYNVPIVNNSNLPTYPIPDMAETLERFLEWVKPLIAQEEYIQAKNLVDSFINSDDAKKLDKKIQEIGSKSDDSWIFNYWFKTYLKSRQPFVPHTNVPMVYKNLHIDKFTVIEKAASLIYGVANTYCDFKENGSGEYYIGKKRFSSDQFHGTLASINHIQKDMNSYYINSGFSTNVVVLYKNHIYSLEVIDNKNKVYSLDAIYNSLKAIYSDSISPILSNINFVTAEPNRDLAGDYLREILENTRNEENYQKIKDSIFILNLDEDTPNSPIDELYCACMDTENFNRWHGKGLEFSISKNATISFVIDHSFCDGGTAVYLVDQINPFIKNLEFNESIDKISYDELLFHIDDEMSLNLIKSFEDYKNIMDTFTASYIDLENLSRTRLREYGILSGDGFFHMALQAAQKMTYGDIQNTYISVDMRMFFRGRTDSNRSVTLESIAFVEELLSSQGDILKQKKLLEIALNAHHGRNVLCRSGKGVDRYLYLLEQVYDEFKDELDIKQNPPILDSAAYKTFALNKIVATSFGHENLKYSYFPPANKASLGMYYIVSDKSFAIITSFNEDVETTNKFSKNLKYSIDKMLEIISYGSSSDLSTL